MLKPRSGFLHYASVGLAAAMLAMQQEVPAFAAAPTPRFERAPEYDGLGRKKKPPQHPNHGKHRRSRAWRDYAARVVATHSDRPDPRDDKYLHAHARRHRALKALSAAA